MNEDSRTSPLPTRRKRRNAEEIMERLLHAAREEFERCGYAGATTAAIAKRADITEAQLFRYFASKAELFRDAIFNPLDRQFELFNHSHLEETPPRGEERLERARHYIEELQQFIEDQAQMLMALAVAQAYSPGSTEGVDKIDSLRAYFDLGAERMTRRVGPSPRVDPELMVRVSFAAVFANVVFKDWLFPAGKFSPETIQDAIADFVLDGINANPDSN